MKGKSKKMKRGIVLVLCVMLGIAMIGCGEVKPAEEPVPSTSEVVSEVVSEEVSESVSEEPLEVVFEIPENGILETHCSDVYELTDFIKETNQTAILYTKVCYDEGKESQIILYNNARYTLEEQRTIAIIPVKEVLEITTTALNIDIMDPDILDSGAICYFAYVETTGVDIEIPFTLHYADGTEETFTVYITKDWKHSWEE